MCSDRILRGSKDSLMPVDFDALPARATVPPERKAVVPGLIALVILVAVGAAISIATWPAGQSTQAPWFWARTFGLPSLMWLLLCSAWRFVHAHRVRNALADNEAIDRKERRLHADASVPFAVVGQSWCFSSVAERNRLEDAMKAHEPAGGPSMVSGLVVPGRAFFRGNEADEARRQATVLEWLLVELVRPFAHDLKGSRGTAVRLCLDSDLTADAAEASVSRAWATLGLRQAEKVQLTEEMSLYAVDAWLDKVMLHQRHLAIAVQLRGVISGRLQMGQAEAGAAVLLASTSAESPDPAAIICAHRPSKSVAESLEGGVANALRWGHCAEGTIETRWNAGLAEPLATAFKSLEGPVNDAPAIELARTIGDVGVATPWLGGVRNSVC
jgi:hypothetical protein